MEIDAKEIPVLSEATMEQALRWIVFGMVPREKRFESLLKYPEVLDQDADWSGYHGSEPMLDYKDAADRLIFALSLGKLSASANVTEGNFTGFSGSYLPDIADSFSTDVPASVWETPWDWQNPYLSVALDEINDRRYSNIRITFENLKALFPYGKPDLETDHSNLSDFPVLLVADIEQAMRWIALGLPPLDGEDESLENYPAVVEQPDAEMLNYYWVVGEFEGAFVSLLKKLKTGKITATGTVQDSPEREALPADSWGIPDSFRDSRYDNGLILHYGDKTYTNIVFQFDELFSLFPKSHETATEAPEQSLPVKSPPEKEKKSKGRPPACSRETWLERMLVLTLKGDIHLDHSLEAIAETLAVDLAGQGVKVSPGTIKRDWIPAIIQTAKGENAKP